MTTPTETCPTCRSTVQFLPAPRGAGICPVCGAVRPVARATDEEPGPLEAGPRSRTGRRVVDVDSNNTHTRKTSGERSRTPPRGTTASRRDFGSPRSGSPTQGPDTARANGALDGSGPTATRTSAADGGTRRASGSAPGSSGTGPAGLSTLGARWRALTDGVASRDGRPWREGARFEPGDVVLHTRHGMGVVERVTEDGSIDVLFRAGYQRLAAAARHADSQATH